MHGVTEQDGSAADAVEFARKMLKAERDLKQAADSLFETIVQNETGAATALATRMLGDYGNAADTVFVALENARRAFGEYDGVSSPREWLLGYVAEEAVLRSTMQTSTAGCDDESQDETGETPPSPRS